MVVVSIFMQQTHFTALALQSMTMLVHFFSNEDLKKVVITYNQVNISYIKNIWLFS